MRTGGALVTGLVVAELVVSGPSQPSVPDPDAAGSSHPLQAAGHWPGEILIVDADNQIGWLLANVLEGNAHRTTAVSTAEQARDHLGGQKRRTLALIDARLPGESGVELLRWIRQRHPSVAVIMLSAVHDPAVRDEALALGAADCVVKPFTVGAICASVAKALHETAKGRSPLRTLTLEPSVSSGPVRHPLLLRPRDGSAFPSPLVRQT